MKQEENKKTKTGNYFIKHYLTPLKHLFIIMFIIQLIFAGFDGLFFTINGYIIDKFIPEGKNADFLSISFFYFGITTIVSIFIKINIFLGAKISQEMMYRIRKDCFEHFQKLSFSYYDKNTIGNLLTRITTDAKNYSLIIAWNLPRAMYLTSFIIGVIIFMIYLNWKVALLMFMAIPLSLVLVIIFRKLTFRASQKVMACNSKLTTAYNDGITGVKTIKSLASEDEFLEKFNNISDEMFIHSKQNLMYTAVFLPFIIASTGFGSGLLLWFGGEDVLLGILSVGTLIIMNFYSRFLADSILFLTRTIGEIQPATASKERLFSLLTAPVEIEDSMEVLEKIKNHKKGVPDLAIDGEPNLINTIEFKDINFYYKENEPVLNNFNLKIETGQSIAIVGETGAGKTTIVSLLCRFYEPVSGKILINGCDYRNRSLYWLQSNFGIVMQRPYLFSGTILENILYGNPHASREKVVEASRNVNAHSFIIKLDKGYETQVGEGGSQLSGGQKQLVSFARAILAEPQILIMDEATSSVDPETEYLIQDGLHKILEGRTSFIIAHRLSTIRRADRILLIANGQITEQGNHDELMSMEGDYKILYEKQFLYYKEQEILGLNTGYN